jgi:hypothetical protein
VDHGSFGVKCVLCAKEIAYCKSTCNMVKCITLVHNKVYIEDVKSRELVPVGQKSQKTFLDQAQGIMYTVHPAIELYFCMCDATCF